MVLSKRHPHVRLLSHNPASLMLGALAQVTLITQLRALSCYVLIPFGEDASD